MSTKNFFFLVISLFAITNLAIVLNIPVLQQLLGFIYLAFLPGLLIVHILKLNEVDLTTKVVLSVGLSVAFAMLFGLIVNSISLALGYTKPLSTIPLLISFGIATVILFIIMYLRNKNITLSFSGFKLTTQEKLFVVVPALFPLLSIVGMRIMNTSNNNALLMFLLFLIPAYIIFISFYNRKVPEKVYPFAIFMASISLLLMYSLRGNHLIGADTHWEYYLFQLTSGNSHWSVVGASDLNACLSISILPSIYQSFLNIDPELLFKLLYSLIVSVLPLVIYLLSKKYVGAFYAFLASAFFMSQSIFLWTPSEARYIIAVLFFALAIMILFRDDISEFSKKLLFIIFAVSIITSHYAATYVAFAIFFLTWIGRPMLSRFFSWGRPAILFDKSHAEKNNPSTQPLKGRDTLENNDTVYEDTSQQSPEVKPARKITTEVVALFLVILFLWYSYATTQPFVSAVSFMHYTFVRWDEFFATEARGGVTQAAFGSTLPYAGIPQRIEFVFSWLTIAFIGIGVLSTIRRFRDMVHIPGFGQVKSNLLSSKFEVEYLALSLAACVLLVFSIVVPYLTRGYDISRIYFQMMVPLSVFFAIGAIMVAKYLRARPYLVLLVVLIPYFLCTTSVMAQVFDYPRAITLNSQGYLYESMYIHDRENYAGEWLHDQYDGQSIVYTDRGGSLRLLSDVKIPEARLNGWVVNRWQEGEETDGYLYLRYQTVVDREIVSRFQKVHDIEEFSAILDSKSKIYANGGSEVYR